MIRLFVIILLVISGLILIQCGGESNAESTAQISKATPVNTMTLKPRTFSEYLEITGTLKAESHIKLIAEEGGILKRIVKEKGRYVVKDDTLAVLENLVLQASFKESVATLKQAELDFNGKQVLYKKKAISENEFLSSKYGLERARAAFDLAKARYDKLFVKAPIKGYVNDRFYDFGGYVMPMTPLFDLVDNSVMTIKAGVAERFKSDVGVGTPVEITFDAFPDIKINEKISFVSQSINAQNRTFEIEIKVRNPKFKLTPEMIANIKLLRRYYENRIVIPLDALIESEKGKYVFIEDRKQARKVNVDILAVGEDSVLVSGLQEKQNLIIVGQRELSQGDKVDVVSY